MKRRRRRDTHTHTHTHAHTHTHTHTHARSLSLSCFFHSGFDFPRKHINTLVLDCVKALNSFGVLTKEMAKVLSHTCWEWAVHLLAHPDLTLTSRWETIALALIYAYLQANKIQVRC